MQLPLNKEEILRIGEELIKAEIKALSELTLDEEFYRAVELIWRCKGKVIVTGVGKSGIIGEKIASTLASTATPALFLQPVAGLHGDLGVVSKEDVILAVSNSGETEELNRLLPSIKIMGVPLISITGNPHSTLAKNSDILLYTKVKKEAASEVIPTTTCIVALALGDALSITLFKLRGLKEEDLALLHPGGAIGKKLLLRVADLMHTGDDIPKVKPYTKMKDVLFEITNKKLGSTTVVDDENKLVGIITDGDLRRLIERRQDENIWQIPAKEAMTPNPKKINKDALCVSAVRKMEEYSITCLLITDEENRIEGIIHLHDILKAGIVV